MCQEILGGDAFILNACNEELAYMWRLFNGGYWKGVLSHSEWSEEMWIIPAQKKIWIQIFSDTGEGMFITKVFAATIMGKGQAFPALLSFDWQLSSSIMHIIWAICGGRAGLALQNHSKVSGIQKFSPKLKSLHHQPWSNVHGHQLLEEQLRSIGKLHLMDRFEEGVEAVQDSHDSANVRRIESDWFFRKRVPKNKFQLTCEIWVLFLQPLHSKVLFRRLAMAISPHKLHTWSLQNHHNHHNL